MESLHKGDKINMINFIVDRTGGLTVALIFCLLLFISYFLLPLLRNLSLNVLVKARKIKEVT